MASDKFKDAQALSDSDLLAELKETEVQIGKLKMDHAIKGLENPLLLREIRRDFARLKTEARVRELKAMTPEQIAGRTKIRARRRK